MNRRNFQLFLITNLLEGLRLGFLFLTSEARRLLPSIMGTMPIKPIWGAGALGIVLFFTVSSILIFRNPNTVKLLDTFIKGEKPFFLVSIILLLLFFESSQDLIFYFSDIQPPHYSAYMALIGKILPYLIWAVIFSAQAIIYLWSTISPWNIRDLLCNPLKQGWGLPLLAITFLVLVRTRI